MVPALVCEVTSDPGKFPVLGDQVVILVFIRAHLAEIYCQEIVQSGDMDRCLDAGDRSEIDPF